MTSHELLTLPQVTERLGLSRATVDKLVDQGVLAVDRREGRIYVAASSVEAYVEQARIQPGDLEHLYSSQSTPARRQQ